MKRTNILVTILVSLAAPASAGDDGLTIIVNVANPAERISIRDLRDYFLRVKREWPDGSKVRFIDRKDSPERKLFFEKVLKKPEEAVERYWIGQKLETGLSAPTQSASDRMSVEFVSAFPGAVGYISASSTARHKDVKAIKLDE